LEEEDTAWALKADIEDNDSETYDTSEDDETRVEVEDADAESVRALSSISKCTEPPSRSLPLMKTFSTTQAEPTPKSLLNFSTSS
jgi:hypothetical protein